MNPLLYKAHPLLFLTMDVLANPAAHTLAEAGRLVLVYFAADLLWACGLCWAVKKAGGFVPSLLLASFLALPATLLYLPTMVTLLADVLAHQFLFADRFILVLCVFTASQMLAAFYALAIRLPGGGVIGLYGGLAISLSLWLASLPVGLALLWVDSVWKLV